MPVQAFFFPPSIQLLYELG